MSQFNNQMTVKIRKDYSWVEYNDTMQACRNLNGAAFKIYIYFSSYCNGDTVDFSPRQVSNELGINTKKEKNILINDEEENLNFESLIHLPL